MRAESFHDTREVRFDLPDGLPEHRTPKGKRPLQPKWLRVSYSLSYPSGRTHVHAELGGMKVENDATYGRSSVGDSSKRSFSTPWDRHRPADTPATFDELDMPEWARPYIEENRPPWCPASSQLPPKGESR